jgi:hypothetical protein
MPFSTNDTRINREGRPKERHVTNKELKMLFKGMLYDNTNYLIERLDELDHKRPIATSKDSGDSHTTKIKFSCYVWR